MVDKSLENALQQMGLDNESVRLILDNKLIAEAVVMAVKNVCDKFRRTMTRAMLSHEGNEPRNYKGSLDAAHIGAAVMAVVKKRPDKRVTMLAVATKMKTSPSYFNLLLKKYPELKKAYDAARNSSGVK